MNENNKIKGVESCTKEYVKYAEKATEKEAVRAMYEYFNTAKYINQIQASS